MGFVDPEMISYLTLMMSIFVVSPTLLEDTKRQKQLEMKFNEILSENNIQNVDEILQRALFKYLLKEYIPSLTKVFVFIYFYLNF